MPDEASNRRLGAIERAAVNAWPALAAVPIDGWLWRFSNGGSQRANSVSALSFVGNDVETAIEEAERRYRACNAMPRFQVSEISAPGDIDQRLAARGYGVVEPCTTLAREIGPGEERPADLQVTQDPTTEWFEVYASVLTEDRLRMAARILESVPRPRAFCAIRRSGQVVSTALAVAQGDVAIAECVATRAGERRSGAGKTVMQGVAAWAAEQGASLVALQVTVANAAAQALYAGLGFERAGSYHMRVLER